MILGPVKWKDKEWKEKRELGTLRGRSRDSNHALPGWGALVF